VTEQELTRRAKRRLAILRHAAEVTGNVALTCRYYGISRQVSYKWRQRYDQHGLDGLRDRAHRPQVSPNTTRTEVVGKTYVKVAGRSRYVYRAIDQFGQVIDVLVSPRRDVAAARRFFVWAIGSTKVTPVEVVTDQAATYPIVLEELQPAAWHHIHRYANNRVEADHRRLKARLGPMRGLKQDASARMIIRRHAFVQDLRRGYYELAAEEPVNRRAAIAFGELAVAI
jgi:transposase, IS6 family